MSYTDYKGLGFNTLRDMGLADAANMPVFTDRYAAKQAASYIGGQAGVPLTITVKDGTGAALVRTLTADGFISYLAGFLSPLTV